MSKILRLEAEAFKRLRVVEITPDGNVVQIKGENGAGKSSVLDSIAAAIGGEKLCPEVPIRRGEMKAHVTIELESLIVTRRWTSKGSYLEVSAKDGSTFKAPQKILDTLIGSLSFDPLAFTRYKPADRMKLVADLVGVNVDAFDVERKKFFDERTILNREAGRLAAQVPAPVVGEVPEAEESVDAILAQIEAATQAHTANETKRAELAKLRSDRKALAAEIKDLEDKLSAKKAQVGELDKTGKVLAAEVAALKEPDLEGLRTRAKSLEATNARVRQKKDRERLQKEAEAKKVEADAMTARLEAIDKAKRDELAAAKWPVPGLGLGEKDLVLNGLPWDQASQAEQLRVALSMGLALNPKLRVVLIREGSLLDAKSLAMVAEIAKAADAQVWVETVGTEGPTGILIEDGAVVGAPPPSKKTSQKAQEGAQAPETRAEPSKPEETKPAAQEATGAAGETKKPKSETKPAASETPAPDGGEDNCPF